jgi:hypothetical protein
MTPADFVNDIVVPTVREFRDVRRSRRRAYLACIIVFHIKDHLRKAGAKQIEDTLRKATGDGFDAVRAVCNGTKHVVTNQSHPYPFVAGDDWDRPPATAGGEWQVGLSQIGDGVGGREIAAGTKRVDLYEAVKSVLSAFCKEFPAHLGHCDVSDC